MSKLDSLMHVINALIATIADAGPEGVPEGVLYAALMPQGCTLAQFQKLVAILIASERVTRSGHVLRIASEARAAS